MTIPEHSRIVSLKEQEWGLNREEIIRTGDPAMHQHSGITGTTIIQEYAKQGLYIYTDSVPTDRGIGIARMQMYFRIPGEGLSPAWTISDCCVNFIRELKKLRWKTYSSKKMQFDNNPQEQIHKKDDHAFDSAKYFATFLSELAPTGDRPAPERPGAFGQAGTAGGMLRYDEALTQQLENAGSSEWQVLESYS